MAATVAGALLAGLPALALTDAPAAAASPLVSASSQLTEETASEQAVATGEPVEVTAARTEYTTTMANPDSTFTLTQSTQPQRARGSDGAWRDVDVTLEKRADGTIGPKAAVADLAFSGGGSGATLIRLGHGPDQELTLGWPTDLPAPTLDGATATYADVPVKGVDLQLTATADGYHEVLVVKSDEAAASSELEKVKLTAHAEGLSVVPGEGGGVRAVDADGNAVFRGPAGLMWDSAGDASTGVQPQLMSAATDDQPQSPAEEADPVQPGEGDASAELPVTVSGGTVSVAPDLELLRGEDTVYPVYIDPSVGLGLSEWTKLSSDGDKFWKFTEPKGVGRCGVADGYYCSTGGYTDRMYFEFGPGALAGKYVLDATFRAYETWSFNCTPYWVDLERTDNISEGTRWPGPKQLNQMGDRYVSAGRADLCSPEQPNSWIEFNDNPDEADENLTSTVRSFAAGKFPRLTLMLRAKDETEPRAWKRFDNNAELKVNYMHKPGVPTSVGVIPGTGTKAECKPSSEPTTVTTITPTVQASVQTLVELHQGDEEGSLQAEFNMERSSDDTTKGTWSKVWSDYKPDSGWHPDGTVERAVTTNRADGGLYRFKSRTQSHGVYGGVNYDLFSPYSSWCYLRIDSTAPKAPTITSNGPYTACTANACVAQGGPGVPGSFTVKPNSADIDVKAYRWRLLTSDAEDTVTVKPATTNGAITITDVTPGLSGTQTLSVESSDLKLDKDGRVRWGDPAQFDFKVALAPGPTGRWRFDDGASGSEVMTAKDTGEVGTRHDAVLRDEAGTGWSTLGRRGAGDYSLRLNDNLSDPAARVGYASTDGVAINTRDSFTVSSWAYLTDDTANHTLLSAPGEYGSAFTLYYSSSYKKWVFNRTAKDPDPTKGESSVYIRSMADAASPPLRAWTHLTGVFDTKGNTDKNDDTIQLFVNGRPQGQPVLLAAASSAYTPWTADRNLMMGRSKTLQSGTGTYGEYFMGRMDEVATWQQALTPDEIRLEGRLEKDGTPSNELVAHWDPTISSGTQVLESPEDPDDPDSTSFPYHRGPLTLSSGASLGGEDATSLVLNGSSGYASVAGPVIDETGSFTVSARVRLNKTLLDARPVGDKSIIAAQANPTGKESSWALWVEKLAADTYVWKFGRTAVTADGTAVIDTAVAPSEEPVDAKAWDTWVDVTGVFDAAADFTDDNGNQQFGVAELYIGPFLQAGQDNPGLTAPQQGTGTLSVGRGNLAGTLGRYLPGDLAKIRVWVGAMTPGQVSSQITEAMT